MTVLTMPAQPGQDTEVGLRPIPWRRMAWVTWRQHRATLISVPTVLGAVAVFLLIAGLKVHHDYATIIAARCSLNGGSESASCFQLLSTFNSTDWTMGNTCLILMQLVPVLIGAFAGAPVLARDLETGTFRYAWTQGFGRDRWTIAKLVLIAIVITAVAGAFGELFAWFFQPFLPVEQMNVLTATVFDTRGVAFAAWTLAAFAVGAFFGMLLRRIVPAMAATLGVYLVLALAAWDLRKYYTVPVVTSSLNLNSPSTPGYPWILTTSYTGPGGKPVSQSAINEFFTRFTLPSGPQAPQRLLVAHGYTVWTRYIPVSHFWPMQFVEGGCLLVLSVLLIAATVWLVRRRAA
jgi:ABC-type transport system involved in multi-copper enzyme maturation permease subunit